MDDRRLSIFFKESVRRPFSEIPTVLIVGTAKLEDNTNLKIKNIFENIPIYQIPGYRRGNNKKVKIPHPGIPYTILSAKCGREIRGIVKNLKDLSTREGNKGKFPNQVSLDVALVDKVVNVFLFQNSIKITGATKSDHLIQTFVFIKAVLKTMHDKGISVWDKSLTLKKVDVCMENVVFDLGFNVRKDILMQKANERGIETTEENDAGRIQYDTGMMKSKGKEKRYHNFRVLHTGKVVFSGTKRKEMAPVYEKFMDFIDEVEADIRFN